MTTKAIAFVFSALATTAGCSSSSSSDPTTTPANDSGTPAVGADAAPDPGKPAADAGGNGMPCDLQITDESGSNVGLTEFAAAAGQGSTTHKSGHPQTQGIHVTSNTTDTVRSIDISVAGDAPTAGASFTADPPTVDANTSVIFALSNVTTGELRAWDGAGGGKFSVVSVTPGSISSYSNVTFAFDQFELVPRALANDNKAQGNFKITGQCTGAITK